VFFVVILIFGVVIGAAVVASKKADTAWRAAAGQLGLRYSSGDLFKSRTLVGRVDGLPVKIDTFRRSSGKNSTRYTRYRVDYPPLGLGLNLSREGVFSPVAEFFGAQDIEVGDAKFDPKVTVKGRDPQAIRQFLTPSRRLRVTNLLGRHDAQIGDSGIQIVERGLVSDSRRLVAVTQQVVLTARELTTEAAEPSTLDRVFQAGHAGHLEDALTLARERPAEDLDLAEVEASLLVTSGRTEEAAAVLEGIEPVAPDPEPNVAPVSEEAPVPEKVVADDVAAEEVGLPAATDVHTGPSTEAFCAEMFVPSRMSFETSRLFSESFEGVEVLWRGTLERVEPFSFDLALGSGPAVRAVLVIHELKESAYSSQLVRCMLRLPPDVEGTWRALRGQEVTFSGRLIRCDGLLRNVYATEGLLHP